MLLHVTCNFIWLFFARLGHREQKDEWSPRKVDVFTRHNVLPADAVVSAGSCNSACTAGRINHSAILPTFFFSQSREVL